MCIRDRNTPVDKLVNGAITWKEYINSLSPEDIAKQRAYDRMRVKKWYQENKEAKQEYAKAYCKEYYQKHKERILEKRRQQRQAALNQQ